MTLIRPKSYEVLVTPLISKNIYGTTLNLTKDVSIDDDIRDKGISSIRREVDNGDFDVGVFVFDSISIKCLNFGGKFSGPNDPRTLFKYSRDKAKVTVNFYNGLSNIPSTSFKGIIDDRASKLDFAKQEIKIKVLSNDSIINRVKVPAGLITAGTTTTSAIKQILQLSDITAVLVYDDAEILPLNEYTIDLGSGFDNKTVKDALDDLLLITNSVLLIDKDTNIISIRSREYNLGSIYKFYGPGDLFGRENLINISKYNDGLHRAFNTFTINKTKSASSLAYIDQYGDNTKKLTFDFITSEETMQSIADDLLDYWKAPKVELEVTAKTSDVKNLNFFDLVTIDYPYRLQPYPGAKFPVYGVSTYGTAVYPYSFGTLKISPDMAFKVVGMEENPASLITNLKLRQIGKEIYDGFLAKIGTFYGSAIYGLSKYQDDSELIDQNYRSHYGAGLYGTVHYGNIL